MFTMSRTLAFTTSLIWVMGVAFSAEMDGEWVSVSRIKGGQQQISAQSCLLYTSPSPRDRG